MSEKLLEIFFFALLLFSILLDTCHTNSEICQNDLYILYNTNNCVSFAKYPDHYLNQSDMVLYPCSLFPEDNCYECDPYLRDQYEGMCSSCNIGYEYNSESKTCSKCPQNTYSIILNNISGCNCSDCVDKCELYTTQCVPLINNEIICPDYAPFFNNLTKSCHEFEYKEGEYKNGSYSAKSKKYKESLLHIFWFSHDNNTLSFPSYNADKSGCLLIELTWGEGIFDINEKDYLYRYAFPKNKKRKFYFFNEEGRGLFDEINDSYEKVVELEKNLIRGLSVSTFLKLNNSDEYRFHLNYENYENILELYDLKTGEITADFAYDIFQLDMEWRDNLRPPRHYRLFELNENNQYLLLFHYQSLGITHIIVIFSFNEIPGKKINFLSLNVIKKYELKENFFYDTYNSNFHFIQTKSGNIFFSLVGQYSIEYDLYIYNLNHFYVLF